MKYLRIHKAYYLNLLNLILLFLLVISSSLIFVTSIRSTDLIDNFFNRQELKKDYLETLLLFFKLIMVVMFCYISGSFYNNYNDSYHVLIPNYSDKKIYYFFTKYLVMILVPIIICYLIFLSFSFFGLIFTNWYLIDKEIINVSLSLIFLLLIYINYSLIFSILIPSSYACFIPGIIFVLNQLLVESIDGFHLIELFFPLVKIDYIGYSYYGIIHLILLYLVTFGITFFIYSFKKKE